MAKVHAAPPVGEGKPTLKFSVKHTSQRPRHAALKLINGPMLFFVGSPGLKQAERCEENKDDGNVGFAIATLVFAVALAPCLIKGMTTVQREGDSWLICLSCLVSAGAPKEKATSHVTKALRRVPWVLGIFTAMSTAKDTWCFSRRIQAPQQLCSTVRDDDPLLQC